MTRQVYFPATDDEFRRILAADTDRAPVLCEGTWEELLRIATTWDERTN